MIIEPIFAALKKLFITLNQNRKTAHIYSGFACGERTRKSIQNNGVLNVFWKH